MSKVYSGIILIIFILFPNAVKDGIKTGLDNGFLILLPAIFPYMIVSLIFVRTGGSDYIAKYLYRFFNFICGLTKKGVSIYILALFCGYPNGARLASIAYGNGEIDKSELLKLFAFSNIPGFGFCVAFFGGSVFKDINLGIKIYLSFVVASVIFAVLLSFIYKGKECFQKETVNVDISQAIVSSILDSTTSIISVIAFVCFFSSIINIIAVHTNNAIFMAIISAFLEITIGSTNIVKAFNPNISIYLCVFFFAFSGLSIIFQSLSFLKKNDINILLFLFLRVLYAIISVITFSLFTIGGF
jgi:hypothetical protein